MFSILNQKQKAWFDGSWWLAVAFFLGATFAGSTAVAITRDGDTNASLEATETHKTKKPKPLPKQLELHLGLQDWRLQLRAYPADSADKNTNEFRVDVDIKPNFQAGSEVHVQAGQKAQSVLAILGDAKIEGEVNGDVLVLLGDARLASNAVVNGSVIIVGGMAEVSHGAKVSGDFLVLAGKLKELSGVSDQKAGRVFKPGGKKEVVEIFPKLRQRWAWLENWVRQGLFWGRPLTLASGWIWCGVGLLALLMVFIQLLLPRAVMRCAVGFNERPGLSLALGVLLALLFPVCILVLVATGIGIVAVPFTLLLLILVLLIGNTGIHLAVGEQVFKQLGRKTFEFPLPALLTGLVVVGLLYLVPILGGVVLLLVLTCSLGASITGLIQTHRQENPPPHLPTQPVYCQSVVSQAVENRPGNLVNAIPPLWETVQHPPVAMAPPASLAPAAYFPAPPLTSSASRLPQTAGFWRRLGCGIIDFVLVFFVVKMAYALFGHSSHTDMRIVLLALMGYYLWLWQCRGTTVGGVLGGLRVVSELDGLPSFKEICVRVFAAVFSGLCLGLGFLAIAWSRDNRGWHDLLAGTKVLHVPKGVSLFNKSTNNDQNPNSQ